MQLNVTILKYLEADQHKSVRFIQNLTQCIKIKQENNLTIKFRLNE